MAATADIGLVGLAVMGENLVLNMLNHGFTVAVYNRTTSKALPPPHSLAPHASHQVVSLFFKIKIH
jgi:6-phosphogluconate dehydrogenase